MDKWQKHLYVMVFIQFVMMLGFSVMAPFLPLFVKELGVTEPGAVKMWAGILTAIQALFAALFSPFWGNLSDKYGRKLMVVRSTLGIAFFTFLISFSQNVYHVLILRILLGCFAGFSAAALTLVASQTPKEKLGYALGMLQSGQVFGLLAGPLIGGIVADLTSYRHVFQVTGAVTLLGGILTIALVHEEFKPFQAEQKPTFLQELAGIWHIPVVQVMFLALFLAQLSLRIIEPIMSLFVSGLVTNQELVSTLTGSIFTVTGIAQALGLFLISRNSDLWGYKHILIIALTGAAAFYFPQALAPSFAVLLLMRFAYGLFMGGILPMANALIGQLTPASYSGRIYGLTSSAFFLGGFIGPLSGGFLAAWLGFNAVFLLTSLLLLANAFWVYRMVPSGKTYEHSLGVSGQ